MAVLLVTYDLDGEGNRPNITNKLKQAFPRCAKISESSYAISTGLTPEQVVDDVRPMLDAKDCLYVVSLVKPFSGLGPNDVREWFSNNLTY